MEIKNIDILIELGKTVEKAKTLLDMLIKMSFDQFQTSISEMGFSNKTKNILLRSGFSTLGDLLEADNVDLLMLPNFGRKALNEVNEKLAEHGLSIRSRRQCLGD